MQGLIICGGKIWIYWAVIRIIYVYSTCCTRQFEFTDIYFPINLCVFWPWHFDSLWDHKRTSILQANSCHSFHRYLLRCRHINFLESLQIQSFITNQLTIKLIISIDIFSNRFYIGLITCKYILLIGAITRVIGDDKCNDLRGDRWQRYLWLLITIEIRRGEFTIVWPTFWMWVSAIKISLFFSRVTLCVWNFRIVVGAASRLIVAVDMVAIIKKPLFFKKPVITEDFQMSVLLSVLFAWNLINVLNLSIIDIAAGTLALNRGNSGWS